jgi:uncharacterized protein YdaU (DUF1376 family)
MHYYQRHIGDYARDTGHLTVYEHGVYVLLLDRLYGTEKPITARDATQIIRPATKRERESVQRVLDDFFTLTASGYINKRAVQEIEKYHEISHKRAASANRRWQTSQSNSDASAMQVHSKSNAIQEPITNNQNRIPEIKKNTPSPPAPTLATGVQRGGGSVWVGELVKPFSERR